MADSEPTTQRSVTLPELIALNDEILALVRARVPLDVGLKRLARDFSGRSRRIASELGEQLERGQSLPDALKSAGMRFPPVYLAVVEAGLRSGRLPAALETVARSTRRLASARRTIVASLIYPLFLFFIAWQLLAFFVSKIAGGLLRLFENPAAPATWVLSAFAALRDTVQIWGPGVPLVVLLLFTLWAYQSSRASLLQPTATGWLFGWLPWLGPMVRSYRQAAFVEILSLLVEHDAPLPEAVRLAAEATGTKKIRRGAEQIASAIERGEKLGAAVSRTTGFSPVLEWLLRSGHDTGTLRSALRHAASVYQRRAQRLATTAQLYMAPLMTVVIGGTVTIVYAGLTFGTWLSLLNMMADW